MRKKIKLVTRKMMKSGWVENSQVQKLLLRQLQRKKKTKQELRKIAESLIKEDQVELQNP